MTLEQFRDHLARQLGIKGRGNALPAEDATYLEEIILNCQDELERIGVATWLSSDIPRWAVEGMVLCCKASISRFGLDINPALKKLGVDTLRYIDVDARTGVGTADYF